MLPLRAVHKPTSPPFFTRLLVLLNCVAFVYQLLHQGDLIGEMGVRPLCYVAPGSCDIRIPGETQLLWQPLFASMFLHAGFLHLAFNVLFLWVFGAGVEEKLGKPRFVLFYFGCGVAAHAAHIVTHPFSTMPAIGASGAIAGVLGAYLVLQPKSWILTYVPPIFLFPVPAPVFLVLWIVSQTFSALNNLPWLPHAQGTDIAWMAHIGGYAAGAYYAWKFAPWWKKGGSGSKARRADNRPKGEWT